MLQRPITQQTVWSRGQLLSLCSFGREAAQAKILKGLGHCEVFLGQLGHHALAGLVAQSVHVQGGAGGVVVLEGVQL